MLTKELSQDYGELLREVIALRSKEYGASLDEEDTCELIDYLMNAIDNTFETCGE